MFVYEDSRPNDTRKEYKLKSFSFPCPLFFFSFGSYLEEKFELNGYLTVLFDEWTTEANSFCLILAGKYIPKKI